jgi:hypothetical protein
VDERGELIKLLEEIRDNQRLSLQRQEEHLAVAREQIERSRKQVEESVALQREAVARFKHGARIVLPILLLCVAALIYLLVRYF